MKTTFRLLATAAIAALAFVSCDKESLTKSVNGASKDGVRTITVSFTATRSELDDLQPSFKAGDMIKVSNGTSVKECEVAINDGVATITTNLTGQLTAVYPASASTDGKTFTVSSSQDGTFAKANICTATIPDGSNPKAEFVNQTAILKFSVPAKKDAKGVDYSPKTIKVKSRGSNSIASGDSKEITITGTGEGGIITPSDGGCYYMAVLPGETISNLTVCSGEGMRCPTVSSTLAANTIYDVALPVLNGHEYVELTMTVNSVTKTYKWATMNVGATSPTDYGLYFAWGEVKGHTPSSWSSSNVKDAFSSDFNAFDFSDSRYTGKKDSRQGFAGCNTPYFDDSETPIKYNLTTGNRELEISDDAANVNWGGSWRMPTIEEFSSLAAWDPEYNVWDATNKGYRLTDEKENSIFLPAAGHGYGTDLYDAGCGYYWSSSLNTGRPGTALYLYFLNDNVSTDNGGCYRGQPVRPLSE